MSPENHVGLFASMIGAVLAALGHSDWQRRRINRLEKRQDLLTEKVSDGGVNCVVGQNMNTRLTRIEQKVPSGAVACASQEDVSLLFEKLEEVKDQVIKTYTILEERLPKGGTK